MKLKTQRILLIGGGFFAICLAAFLALISFQDALVFYYLPSDLPKKKIAPNQRVRVGGFVEKGSFHQKGQDITFRITDEKSTLAVHFQGVLPDLFREGQGVVAEGYLESPSVFQAKAVLAKHDEKYMPKEVSDQLKQQGLWQDAQ